MHHQFKKKYIYKETNKTVGKTIHQYGLLEDGDRILAAVSGGVDSLVMLWFLRQWLEKAPINYTLIPVYLDMGFGGYAFEGLKSYFSTLQFSFHVEQTDYGRLAHSNFNKEKSPCFLCSMLRRKRLFELAGAYGCNKIAMGHNQEDLIETFFMNLCYAGEMSTIVPKQVMFRGMMNIIRPLALVQKKMIQKIASIIGLTSYQNPCPSAGMTSRQHIKELLQALYKKDRRIKNSMINALGNIKQEYLL